MDKRPLILTLQLNPETQAFFDGLREIHFPPARNYLRAHLTLFHALPGEELTTIQTQLKEVTKNRSAFKLEHKGWKVIGKGVAFILQSPQLMELHRILQSQWRSRLTPQDAQGLWPHITIQNKVSPELAKSAYEQVKEMQPPAIQATGLCLFYYDNGPWEFIESYSFPSSHIS